MEYTSYARQSFSAEIDGLEHDLLEMGSRAEEMIALGVEALRSLSVETAREVLRRDDDIDERDSAIEQRCLRLLALQQPMAGDLRVVGTAMKMITDIERIADLACDVAKIAMKIELEMGDTTIVDVPLMANEARYMFREALEAFVRRDIERVRIVCERDEIVDDLYRDLRAQLFADMKAHSENVVVDGWLLLAIHHIERIADHVVNIAERVHFMVTGEVEKYRPVHALSPSLRADETFGLESSS
jgi:phosphate transport system protein